MCGQRYYVVEVAALWIEALLYGAYALVFSTCCYLFAVSRLSKLMLCFAVAMFTMSTGLMLVDFALVLLAPLLVTSSICDGGTCYSCYPETPARVHQVILADLLQGISSVLMTTNQMVADSLLTYRAVWVWGKNFKVAVLPVIMITATAGCGYANAYYQFVFYYLRRSAPPTEVSPPPQWFTALAISYKVTNANFILTTVTNVFLTILIAARLWWTTRGFSAVGVPVSTYYRVISMILESAAVLSLAFVAALIVHNDASVFYAIDVFTAIIGQMTGIVPTVIIVIVGLGKATETSIVVISDRSPALLDESKETQFFESSNTAEDVQIASAAVCTSERTASGSANVPLAEELIVEQ
ncbi:hypothetical protein JAAARDRAFT_72062 [Jaapia argillacea MUCL 33604]|uniref:Uncharacterized protein n=1 Tax=Jaapia argillacea MUCL 33604 TaxID=933084 RepID=A0A067PHJ3_9AGAM|nr:hypothetical protein JAAARDRAFT_72062 [Jaapia argillacea MUCL 33604]